MIVSFLFLPVVLSIVRHVAETDLCSLLTVVIVTSPPATAPDITLFASTYDYLQQMPCAQHARFMVGLHISPDKKEERFWQYEANMREWHARHKNAVFVVANFRSVEVAFSRLLSLVETKYYLFWEHDWRFCREISLPAILQQMEIHRPAINYVRFNKWQTLLSPDGSIFDAVLVPCEDCFVPMLFVPSWSNNPHVARYSFFLEHCRPLLEKDPDAAFAPGFFEWPLTLAVTKTMRQESIGNATAKWGTFIYGHLKDAQLVYHLDGQHSTDNSHIQDFARHCPT